MTLNIDVTATETPGELKVRRSLAAFDVIEPQRHGHEERDNAGHGGDNDRCAHAGEPSGLAEYCNLVLS